MVILFFLFFGLSLSLSYDPKKAVEFAKGHCSLKDKEFFDEDIPYEDAFTGTNFVTQCLIAGGFDISNCKTDGKGSISEFPDLFSCLKQKGWKSSSERPKRFKAGYPLIVHNSLWSIATEVNATKVTFASLSGIISCNMSFNPYINSQIFFYLD